MDPVVSNKEIANLLSELAYYKKLDGQSVFRVKPYQQGALFMLEFNDNPLTAKLTDYDGIGKKTASCIREAAETGTIGELDKFRLKFPDLRDLEKVSGVGPKKALKLNEAHGITTREELLALLESGKLDDQKLLNATRFSIKSMERIPRPMVERRVEPILDTLRPYCSQIEVVGSLRRKRDTIKDVDILVVTNDRPTVMEVFAQCGEVISAGDEKSSIRFDGGAVKFQIDLLCVDAGSWGAALNYFTGSKEHNIELRTMAKAKGLTVNEHGIFNASGDKVGGEFETDLYDILGIQYVPPVLRDFKLKDITDDMRLFLVDSVAADLHTHTNYSDGKHTVEEMVAKASSLGLKVFGVSDHIANAVYGNKLMAEELRKSWLQDIEEAQKNHPEIKVLKGAELDINVAGELIVPEGLEDDLDYIIASAHTSPDNNLTERFLKAMENPKVKVLGHPSGRQFGTRDAAEADWDLIFKTAADKGVAIEVNGQPPRLDCVEPLLKKALKYGCKISITSDAHSTDQIESNLRYALEVAQRGGCTTKDIVEDM